MIPLVLNYENERYITQPATDYVNCAFYCQDGGYYDACVHPDKI
jgi:hypothetical protein